MALAGTLVMGRGLLKMYLQKKRNLRHHENLQNFNAGCVFGEGFVEAWFIQSAGCGVIWKCPHSQAVLAQIVRGVASTGSGLLVCASVRV